MDWTRAGDRDDCDRMIGLELHEVVFDRRLTKARCGGEVAGRTPTDRGKLAIKRSTITDTGGRPLCVISAAANQHDSQLLARTSDVLNHVGLLPERSCVHLDAG
jgi:hypothetical protein